MRNSPLCQTRDNHTTLEDFIADARLLATMTTMAATLTRSKSKKSETFPFYAVASGRTVGIFNQWEPVKISTNAYSKNKYKGHSTVDGAAKYLVDFGFSMDDIVVHISIKSDPNHTTSVPLPDFRKDFDSNENIKTFVEEARSGWGQRKSSRKSTVASYALLNDNLSESSDGDDTRSETIDSDGDDEWSGTEAHEAPPPESSFRDSRPKTLDVKNHTEQLLRDIISSNERMEKKMGRLDILEEKIEKYENSNKLMQKELTRSMLELHSVETRTIEERYRKEIETSKAEVTNLSNKLSVLKKAAGDNLQNGDKVTILEDRIDELIEEHVREKVVREDMIKKLRSELEEAKSIQNDDNLRSECAKLSKDVEKKNLLILDFSAELTDCKKYTARLEDLLRANRQTIQVLDDELDDLERISRPEAKSNRRTRPADEAPVEADTSTSLDPRPRVSSESSPDDHTRDNSNVYYTSNVPTKNRFDLLKEKPERIKKNMLIIANSHSNNLKIDNLAGGKTVEKMTLEKKNMQGALEYIATSLIQPESVLLHVADNDVSKSTYESLVSQFDEVVQACYRRFGKDVEIIVSEILPRRLGSPAQTADYMRKARLFNDKLHNTPHFHVISHKSLQYVSDECYNKDQITGHYVHMNKRGLSRYVMNIKSAIAKPLGLPSYKPRFSLQQQVPVRYENRQYRPQNRPLQRNMNNELPPPGVMNNRIPQNRSLPHDINNALSWFPYDQDERRQYSGGHFGRPPPMDFMNFLHTAISSYQKQYDHAGRV